jgi:potassium-dependent mechanosensitive channel
VVRTSIIPASLHGLMAAAIVLLLATVAPAWADAPAASAPATVPAADSMSIASVQARIASLASDKTVSDAARAKVLELYQSAIAVLQNAQEDAKRTAALQDVMDNGAARAKAIRKDLQQPRPVATSEPQTPLLTVKEIEPLAAAQRANLATLQTTLNDLDRQIKGLHESPTSAAEDLAAARRDHDRASDAAGLPVVGDTPVEADAQRTLDQARVMAAAAHVRLLELRQISTPARLDLLTAQRDQAAARVAAATAQVQGIYKQLALARRTEDQQIQADAQRAVRDAAGQQQAVRDIAAETARLGRKHTEVVSLIEQAVRQIQAANTQLQKVSQSYEVTKQQLEIEGVGADLAEVLRKERHRLPSPEQFRRDALDVRQRINDARMQRLQIDQERQNLDDVDARAAQIVAEQVPASLPAAEREAITGRIRALLSDRRDLVERLNDLYTHYLDILNALESTRKKALVQTTAFSTLLDERLLWIPSAAPVGRDWVSNIAASVRWLADPDGWVAVGRDLAAGALEEILLVGPVLLVAVTLLVARRRLKARLETLAVRGIDATTEHFGLTALALLVTVALVLPGPLLLWLAGWLLSITGDASELVRDVGAGFSGAATLWFILQLLRQLCGRHGLVDAHFHWHEDTRLVLRRNLSWLLFTLVPLHFILVTTRANPSDIYANGLGRLVFVGASAVLLVFLARTLRPRGGAFSNFMAAQRNGWLWKLRFFWYPVAVIVPLVMGTAALLGYYYAAGAIQERLFKSILLILAAVLVYNLVIRWLRVAQQKFSQRRARESHDAAVTAQAGVAAAEAAGQAAPRTLEVPHVDLVTINDHTRSLLNVIVGVAVAAGLWWIWVDLLPALRILSTVTVWNNTLVTAAGTQVQTVTLADLGLAVLLAALTVVATRNLTGFMELALLHRLSLDAGIRYAINRVATYLVITVGSIATLNTLGIGWSNVQWLAAAFTVGLGFGLQEIFANFVSGLIILFERPLRVGDIVTVDDLSGTVARIRMRATTITDWDNKEIIVPNKTFITQRLVNWTLSDPMTRLVIKIGIAYGSDTALAERLMLEIANAHPLVVKEPAPTVFFLSFGDSALNFELRVFVKQPANRNPVINDIHMALDQTFRKHNIEIPFPQQDVHLRSSDAVLNMRSTTSAPENRPG